VPTVRILAMSRETLRVPGEIVWRVPPLSVPESQTPLDLECLMRSELIPMILVTGATGMFGSRIVRELAARHAPVRAMVRDPARARAITSAGIGIVQADLDQPATLVPALQGIERVFLVSPMDERVADRERAMIDAAVAAGFVAADDVGRAGAVVLAERHEVGANYEITGPAALSWPEVAAI